MSDGLMRLCIGLENVGLDVCYFLWLLSGDKDRAPYRGLFSLDEIDVAVYFGRDV